MTRFSRNWVSEAREIDGLRAGGAMPGNDSTTPIGEIYQDQGVDAMKRYSLPELPYDYAALEPHYSARLLELHHNKQSRSLRRRR
jgi:hypothetical protein